MTSVMSKEEEEEERARNLIGIMAEQETGTYIILLDHAFTKIGVDSWYDNNCSTNMDNLSMAEEIAYKESGNHIWSFS